MMKKLYEDLKIEIISFSTEDIITASMVDDWDTEELEDEG